MKKDTTVSSKEARKAKIDPAATAGMISGSVTWKKVYDVTDTGQLGGDTRHCGGSVDGMPLTWGGPIATFRWDSTTDVDFKWLSVRELSDAP